ncbi:hypothetical protein E6Q11_05565 [Candidatus Dojkabacteria bacterium]|uniref:Uncharacterized protein n=1 Tax=Candidatus Dojkabacteria bacterium TaxID=2099670 RepID=A0A5C7J3V4_9BACT|nr:MAG: hypothetical protein E6Q11_05565 [Candidatus Dojkabacteria bacterium]
MKKDNKKDRSQEFHSYSGKYWKYFLIQEKFSHRSYINLYDFHWGYVFEKWGSFINGPLSSFARKEAGKALYLLIFDYCEKNDVTMEELELCIFAFSHGGNVAAEFLNEVKRQKNNELKVKQLFFFETPKTEQTERAIHQKSTDGKSYIAEHILDINIKYPKDMTQMIDFTASFPCCARQFLFSRKNLFEFFLTDPRGYTHNDIMDYVFLKSIKYFFDKRLQKGSLNIDNNKEFDFFAFEKTGQGRATKELRFSYAEKIISSRNIFRWLLYYRKFFYISLLGYISYKKFIKSNLIIEKIKKYFKKYFKLN